jgi:hypothetical protein
MAIDGHGVYHGLMLWNHWCDCVKLCYDVLLVLMLWPGQCGVSFAWSVRLLTVSPELAQRHIYRTVTMAAAF